MLYKNTIVQEDMEQIICNDYIPFEKLNHKTVFVTGANGMLAYYVVCVLMHLNFTKNYHIRVIALARNEEKAKKRFADFLQEDQFLLLTQDVCKEILLQEKVHYIIHAAGASSPKFIHNDPVGIILANTQGTINILEFAKKCSVENIVFTSTREVYGKITDRQWIEENDMGILDPLDPRSCYPESKRMAEQILKSYRLQYGIPFTIARIAHSYGPGIEINQDGRVLSDFISDVVSGKDIILKSEGTAVRAFCYITDAVSALFTILLKGNLGEAYNIANETEPMMIRDIADTLVKIFPEKNLKVVYKLDSDQSGYCNYKRVGLATKKLENLGWIPNVRLLEGMKRTVRSFGKEQYE